MHIKKAVIPAAGLGTRFLPATKAQPKEMLPIVDKPAIQYIVEEAVQSGIENILIVTGRNKKSIEDHFDKSVELEHSLYAEGKQSLLEEVQAISEMANIHFIRQKEPLGLGHAIGCARQFVGDDAFAVLLGDDIMVSDPPALAQMVHLYEKTGNQIIGVRQVDPANVSKYGIIDSNGVEDRVHRVTNLVEKPSLAEAPSRTAVMGRYILKPSIFPILDQIERGAGGEYQLTDALKEVSQTEELLALELEGRRYDIGDQFGYIQAILEIGLMRKELQPMLTPYLQKLATQWA
ncbi:UTP--glucose-1-phosphate uridylyltransferase GalU [Paenibacillus amylolyticus]|uniref:UTP--glucose-1-phosphate uridylyltransferase n=1 Tax=Paenibacillus amylolyticus TaxID=1451 RepID=A0A100VKI0_PAEAM|nr:UTP--glucose-1-phosphate uridylyltransferase GalU [Paenibacillus amylolyticus]GAS81476.1 UTP-glucose-1-phosphate uridylyltransferase [Paenibacillus amylolyticus]